MLSLSIFKRMVMFKRLFFVCCLLCLPYITQASDDKDLSPEEVVGTFYHDYLTAAEMADMESADDLSWKAMLKYTTTHLRVLRDNDDSGADYFLDAQEICEEWKDNINTETAFANNNVAKVKLKLGYGKGISLFAISLVKEQGKWLMDSVTPIPPKSVYCPRQANAEQ